MSDLRQRCPASIRLAETVVPWVSLEHVGKPPTRRLSTSLFFARESCQRLPLSVRLKISRLSCIGRVHTPNAIKTRLERYLREERRLRCNAAGEPVRNFGNQPTLPPVLGKGGYVP